MTAALGRQRGASILLRIDDLDRERVDRAYIDDIFSTLRFMGIPWDEGPADAFAFERSWSQVHRMELYRLALARLRLAGAVFACSCSRADLARSGNIGGCPGGCRERGLSLDASGVAWRLMTDSSREMRVRTIVGAGDDGRIGARVDAVLPEEMRDFVVMKKDGFPAYQLTSLMDDVYYGIDLIVRGDDLWPSTLAQYALSCALGATDIGEGAGFGDAGFGPAAFRESAFYHHALLLGDGGAKLSKSAGATSIRYLRQSGLGPGAIYSLILRMLGIDQAVNGWEEFAARLGF